MVQYIPRPSRAQSRGKLSVNPDRISSNPLIHSAVDPCSACWFLVQFAAHVAERTRVVAATAQVKTD